MSAIMDILAGRPANCIGGVWEAAPETMPAVNPATGEVLALLPRSGREVARRAVAAAAAAQGDWARKTAWERAALCVTLAGAIDAEVPRLARVLSLEQGKPLAQALGEVGKAADGFRMAAEQVKYLGGETLPVETPGLLVMTRRAPRGVYAVITPWNFPVNIPVEYLAPAIATGNAVVWVPAPSTSLVAIEFMRVLDAAGLPAGLVDLVVGEGAVVGDEIVASPDTQAIGFTGSAATGRRIAERGAGKPMLLELGGNGPVIVRADADLEKAAAAAAGGAFFNAGQVCAARAEDRAEDRAGGAALAARAARIADFVNALLPGAPGWPSGATLGVQHPLAERLVETFGEGALAALDAAMAGDGTMTARVAAFETADPVFFGRVRDIAFLAYYEHPVVVGIIDASGRPYRLRPHLGGYDLPKFDLERDRPRHNRGGYVATEDVRRVEGVADLELDTRITTAWGVNR